MPINMFCPRCGKKLDGSGVFCVNCGAPLGAAPSAGASSSHNPSLKAENTVHNRQGRMLAVGVGLSVLWLVIVIVIVAAVAKRSSQDDRNNYDSLQQRGDYGGSYSGGGASGNTGGSAFDTPAQQTGHMEMCAVCYGTGVCAVCDGSGKVWGWKQKVTCTSCHGSCSCVYCSGTGYVYVPY